MIKNLGEQNSVFNQYIAEIRDIVIQRDPWRFRKNMERLGAIFGYEISRQLEYIPKEIITPLGSTEVNVLKSLPVLATILRAGLPLHQGLLNAFDRSENAFVSAYRKHSKDGGFKIQVEYVSGPELTNRILILSDPMLATGASLELSYKALMSKGKPRHTHIVTLIASTQGVDYMQRHLPMKDITLWVGAIDDELTAQAYIVPGLGDAGDLAFGSKL
ncbi:MAG: uracil phosphoribosyltransferase [Lentimicrobium sp.]|jgi:uracil phosphoribosyltransferase|nr:uracil phosphoribosyltransferase [Lentimicrobium sp.]MDD2527778.1 uracil phosphoribosyltransferase [Lentimicrobiaceae bacterium]MDD4598275.1 uracil phosphoribosyltransferase [Lentimicrobiaceae bacterium]MDY0025707.1 uracil phosphoribosyltransferase [Lentimicrobium sp.]HAH57098.1 uracil phosphoribosyltransferase [Bacteroidales bacterium]